MHHDNAITVQNVSKSFRIPHEKVDSVKGLFVNLFKKKTYEEFHALKDVSFEIKKGEFFGIVGRNGSGKSTLLKVLAGIYAADAGSVVVNGRISPFLELGIGFNPELSGRDNVYLNATVLGLTKKQIDEKFDDIVAFAELEQFIDEQLKNYSSGMQVRLAFAVSIHAKRDILLMDEVLAVGDSNFQAKCLEEFNQLRARGKTVILVTHDISVVQRYCDRALLLRKGKIEKIGNPKEVNTAYVYQNISDEEKRLQKILKNDEIDQEEKSSRIATIEDVEFLDKNDKKKSIFETGETIQVKICYDTHREVDTINIGIGIHKENASQVCGFNTQMDQVTLNRKKGHIIVKLKNAPLLKGKYFVNVVLFGNEESCPYDFKPKYKIFEIYSLGIKNNYRGILYADHEWY